MAMLAGPRRKQKVINLRAKNNAWSNDSNKFGQRMLEKMGWSSGKGLGAKENGIVEHVVARYKNDERGLGFDDKNDQWTKNEDDFNALLSNLSNTDENKEILHSGVSLEVKSKKSKARIHYHKFTRGKDLSRYSKKDLANIFGKKSFDKQAVVEESLKEDVKTTEQVFTEKGNMDDYFKNKMAALKSKSKFLDLDKESTKDMPDYSFQGFSITQETPTEGENKDSSVYQTFSFYSLPKSDSSRSEPQECLNNEKSAKIKKKSKKKDITNKEENCQSSENLDSEENQIENSETHETFNKKSKKKKCKEQNEHEYIQIKKKKKDKRDSTNIEDTQIQDNIVCVEEYVPKKKKKRKNKDV